MTPVLAAYGMTRTFGGGAGVHLVDLEVQAGEIHALVGLNGAGKTTLMKLLLGMLRPTAGQVCLDGTPLAELPSAAWSDVGHVIEYPLAYGDLTTRQNLELAARMHNPRAARPTDVDAGIAAFGLQKYTAMRARQLSAGNRQRLGLACALQHRPRVIVLDEPGNTLDPAGTLLLRDELRRRRDAGAGILVSSHHLDEVARIADRISVLNAGRLIGTLDPRTAELERAFFAQVLADDQEQGRA